MSKRNKKLFNLAFLLVFFSITLFINFFHTEKTFARDDNCPACHFLNSAFATSQIHFFHLPPLPSLGIYKTYNSFDYSFLSIIEPTSRSPPQI
jgi:hypothetical protein